MSDVVIKVDNLIEPAGFAALTATAKAASVAPPSAKPSPTRQGAPCKEPRPPRRGRSARCAGNLQSAICNRKSKMTHPLTPPTPTPVHPDTFWALKDVSFEVNRGEVLRNAQRSSSSAATAPANLPSSRSSPASPPPLAVLCLFAAESPPCSKSAPASTPSSPAARTSLPRRGKPQRRHPRHEGTGRRAQHD